MTTAVVAPPVSSTLAPPSLDPISSATAAVVAARSYASIAPAGVTLTSTIAATASPAAGRSSAHQSSSNSHSHSPPNMADARLRRTDSDENNKPSPKSNHTPHIPKVIVKKEPTSPSIPTSRHRPRRLDLSNHTTGGAGKPSAPLTSKESAGGSAGNALVMHDVGLACLSPGFNTQDPTMQQQLQRSMSVRDQQRLIIEARQKGVKPPGDPDSLPAPPHTAKLPSSSDGPLFRPTKMPNTGRRKGPPPALSIAPPSADLFAHERVVQSAPLGQSFTGLRPHGANAQVPPHLQQRKGRGLQQQQQPGPAPPPTSTGSSHIQHVPANQTSNRLPPISDVFSTEVLAHSSASAGPRTSHVFGGNTHSPGTSSHSNNQPPLPSPGYPAQFQQQQNAHQQPLSSRRREFKSAEEAMQSLTGGREDLLPRVVHYGGHQPPTPPSPVPGSHGPKTAVGLGLREAENIRRSGNISAGRRRDRDEYERDNASPLGGRSGGAGARRWWAEETEEQRRKKDEFLSLCSKAWDLFHS